MDKVKENDFEYLYYMFYDNICNILYTDNIVMSCQLCNAAFFNCAHVTLQLVDYIFLLSVKKRDEKREED